jgi:phospholipase/lecithinase/hemolysin
LIVLVARAQTYRWKLMKRRLILQLIVLGLTLGIVGIGTAAIVCGSQQCIYLPLIVSPTAVSPSATSISGTPTAITNPVVTPTLNPNPKTITGLAILGDSTQDEYQADNPRGEEYNRTTLNWVEQLTIKRNINLGAIGTRPEPRRSGYDFNWARSGATSDQMIRYGQHTGAAQQVQAGQVSHALIQIGINDFYFSGLGLEIYNGTLSDTATKSRLNQISDNIIAAAQTLKNTGRCQVLIAATQDYLTLPIVPELYITAQDPAGRKRYIDAVAYLNQRLATQSSQLGVAYFDFNAAYLAEVQSRLNADGFLVVGGELIDLQKRGNEPHFGLLDDQYIHPGTVLAGLYANVYMRAMNQHFQTAFLPFSDDEILQTAGIKP